MQNILLKYKPIADAIAMLEAAGKRHCRAIRHVPVGVEIAVQAAARTSFHTDLRAGILARYLGDDVDGATDRVAAVQRALRAAQNFNTFDIRQAPVLAHLAPEINTIDGHADARINCDQVILDADAALAGALDPASVLGAIANTGGGGGGCALVVNGSSRFDPLFVLLLMAAGLRWCRRCSKSVFPE